MKKRNFWNYGENKKKGEEFVTSIVNDLFLSHLLIAGCNIGVQISVPLSFPSATSITINFSVPMIARIMKPCKVIIPTLF